MKRRTFLKSTLAASCISAASPLVQPLSGQDAGKDQDRQYFSWRRYACKNKQQHELVSRFLEEALVPALSRLNIKPVGVFTHLEESPEPSIFTLVPFDSFDHVARLPEQLRGDDQFMQAAADYLGTEKSNPAYERIEGSLMKAFEGMPRVKIPRTGDRIFELRVYESHNELKAMLKVEMFNEAEFEIFRKVHLDPVFFGQTMFGANLPNLTYMLGYKDMEEHDRNWKAFLEHPDWKTLKANDRYKDTVSKIINYFLKPTSYSQI